MYFYLQSYKIGLHRFKRNNADCGFGEYGGDTKDVTTCNDL
jgi:hypothetical protein